MMANNKSRSLELFFVDGDPDGLITATIPFQWTGYIISTPRTRLKKALTLNNADAPGVYILVGEQDGVDSIYIGETDNIGKRITQHEAAKDWWSTAIFITSNGEPLNKAHARYLESRLLETAKEVGRAKRDNGQYPLPPPLSDVAKAHMDDFLDNVMVALPALRFDFLQSNQRAENIQPEHVPTEEIYRFAYSSGRHGFSAKARLEGSEFIVEKGSIARKEWVGTTTANSYSARKRLELVANGILVEDGDCLKFTESYAFNSTSAAATVVSGRPTSGPGSWKLEGTDTFYGDWEKSQIEITEGIEY